LSIQSLPGRGRVSTPRRWFRPSSRWVHRLWPSASWAVLSHPDPPHRWNPANAEGLRCMLRFASWDSFQPADRLMSPIYSTSYASCPILSSDIKHHCKFRGIVVGGDGAKLFVLCCSGSPLTTSTLRLRRVGGDSRHDQERF